MKITSITTNNRLLEHLQWYVRRETMPLKFQMKRLLKRFYRIVLLPDFENAVKNKELFRDNYSSRVRYEIYSNYEERIPFYEFLLSLLTEYGLLKERNNVLTLFELFCLEQEGKIHSPLVKKVERAIRKTYMIPILQENRFEIIKTKKLNKKVVFYPLKRLLRVG